MEKNNFSAIGPTVGKMDYGSIFIEWSTAVVDPIAVANLINLTDKTVIMIQTYSISNFNLWTLVLLVHSYLRKLG